MCGSRRPLDLGPRPANPARNRTQREQPRSGDAAAEGDAVCLGAGMEGAALAAHAGWAESLLPAAPRGALTLRSPLWRAIFLTSGIRAHQSAISPPRGSANQLVLRGARSLQE